MVAALLSRFSTLALASICPLTSISTAVKVPKAGLKRGIVATDPDDAERFVSETVYEATVEELSNRLSESKEN